MRLKRSKYILIIGVIYCLIIQSSCNIIENDGYESGGTLLFVNKYDSNILIVEQEFETGAWDTEVTKRIILKKINESSISNIDTSLLIQKEWVRMNVEIRDWDDHGNYFYNAELKSIRQIKDSKFRHHNLIDFGKILLPTEQYDCLRANKCYYSVQDCSEKFKAFVFYSGGGLVLQTVNNNFENIDFKELMKLEEGPNYSYHKTSSFTSQTSFTMVKNYKSFERDTDGLILPSSLIEITFTTNYNIGKNGDILKVSKEEFGVIEIKRC